MSWGCSSENKIRHFAGAREERHEQSRANADMRYTCHIHRQVWRVRRAGAGGQEEQTGEEAAGDQEGGKRD